MPHVFVYQGRALVGNYEDEYRTFSRSLQSRQLRTQPLSDAPTQRPLKEDAHVGELARGLYAADGDARAADPPTMSMTTNLAKRNPALDPASAEFAPGFGTN